MDNFRASIDPDAFTFPAPKILIGPGERALVFDALNWGAPERRTTREDGKGEHVDPIRAMWATSREHQQAAIEAENHGYTMEQLRKTAHELQRVIDDPNYADNPTRDCLRAHCLVTYAMQRLHQGH